MSAILEKRIHGTVFSLVCWQDHGPTMLSDEGNWYQSTIETIHLMRQTLATCGNNRWFWYGLMRGDHGSKNFPA